MEGPSLGWSVFNRCLNATWPAGPRDREALTQGHRAGQQSWDQSPGCLAGGAGGGEVREAQVAAPDGGDARAARGQAVVLTLGHGCRPRSGALLGQR